MPMLVCTYEGTANMCTCTQINIKWVYNYIPIYLGTSTQTATVMDPTITQSSWFHCWITLLAMLNSDMFLKMSTTGLKSSGHFRLPQEALQRSEDACIFFQLL